MRLIDANYIVKTIERAQLENCKVNVLSLINDAPTIEPTGPRGHWQVIGYHVDKYFYCKCSNCQKKTKVFYDKTNPGEFVSLADIKRNVNFCMFCGADMREGREDET